MSALELAHELGHEELVLVSDRESGLRAVVAIHDTTLGPGVGGTRMRPYPRFEDAVRDALLLSRAMTYKAAMAGIERGGAKAVIDGDPGRHKTRALLTTYARAVDRFAGRFHTGPDMGIDPRDLAVMGRITRHVSHPGPDSPVDAADLTALGVHESIRATAGVLGMELDGLRVALQGLGQVGQRLARRLRAEGARLTVCDSDPARVERVAAELDVEAVAPDAIYDVEADVFSPNAMGGILDDETLPRLRCRGVAGAANNQLREPRHGDALHARGVLVAPDYVVSAGGLASLLFESGELGAEAVRDRVREIGTRVGELLRQALDEDRAPFRVADGMVEERLEAARERRREARRPGPDSGW
jgi:leucine dehydrogenase